MKKIKDAMYNDHSYKTKQCGHDFKCDVEEEEKDDKERCFRSDNAACSEMDQKLRNMKKWSRKYNCQCSYTLSYGKKKTKVLKDISDKIKKWTNKINRVVGKAICEPEPPMPCGGK